MTTSVIDPDSGGGEDYSDIALWAAQDRDLVTATDTEIGEVRPTSGGACTVTNAELNYNGWTTSATYYMELKPASGYEHPGSWDTSAARVVVDSSTDWHSFRLSDQSFLLTNMQYGREGVSGGRGLSRIDNTTIQGCLIRGLTSGEPIGNTFDSTVGETYKIINNVFSGYINIVINEWWDGGSSDGVVYNNTIKINTSSRVIGLDEGSGQTRADYKNNLIINDGSGDCWSSGSAVHTTAANYTSDTTSPDGASYESASPTFEDAANHDLHLASGDDGSYEGSDLSSDSEYSFSNDIDGDTRSDWDAGADEYVAGGGGTTQSVGIVTETDSALGIAGAKNLTAGLVSETDVSLGVAAAKAHGVGLSAETDVALSTAPAKTVGIGVPSEADQAFGVASAKRAQIALAAETDSALAAGVSGATAVSVGLVTEADAALAAVSAKYAGIGLTTETDTALAASVSKSATVGLPEELASALQISVSKRASMGLAAEVDTSLGVTSGYTIAVGLIDETDTALAVGWAKSRTVGMVAETDTSLPLVSIAPAFLAGVTNTWSVPARATTWTMG